MHDVDGFAPADTAADLDLLRGVGQGDAASLAALFDRHAPVLYGVIARIAGEGAAAGMILEDVLLQVWTGREVYDSAFGSPRAWLVALARCRAVEATRLTGGTPGDGLPASIPGLPGLPTFQVPGDTRRSRIARALAALPEPDRQLIVCAFLSGCGVAELAKKLELPESTVLLRLRSGLLCLRDGLRAPEDAPDDAPEDAS